MCLEAAGDLGSGRTAITGPMVPTAFCTSWRPAIGMAQCGSILTTTCRTSCPSACALAIESVSYSVHGTGALFAVLPREFLFTVALDAVVFEAATLFLTTLPAAFFPLRALLFFRAVVRSSIRLLSARVAGILVFLRYAAIISAKM